MKDDEFKGLPDDTDEWIRLLQSDDGRAAREHLDAGRAIYYRDGDTPIGLCIKKYPDGHRELVRFSVEHGEQFVSSLSPCVRLGLLDGKLVFTMTSTTPCRLIYSTYLRALRNLQKQLTMLWMMPWLSLMSQMFESKG